MSQPNALKDAEQAVARAFEFTGFSRLQGINASARLATIQELNVPFLSKSIAGREVWRVEIQNVRLRLDSAIPGFRDRYLRSFVAFLDPASGQLLRIASAPAGAAGKLRPEPGPESAAEQLRNEEEIYHGFPEELPAIGLLDALDRILSDGIGSPFLAQEINALYLTHSRLGSEIRPVWAVTLRGIPPIEARGPKADSIPEWQRNHMRNVVDATNGSVILATNSPQPE